VGTKPPAEPLRSFAFRRTRAEVTSTPPHPRSPSACAPSPAVTPPPRAGFPLEPEAQLLYMGRVAGPEGAVTGSGSLRERALRHEGLYPAFYEAAGRVKYASCPPRDFVFSVLPLSDRLSVSRGSVILLFALMRGEPCGSPAQEGIRGWGRHLRSGPATAAKAGLALTHPSNLCETWSTVRIVRSLRPRARRWPTAVRFGVA